MTKKKHTYQFEVTLSVADYEGDFESCKNDFNAATDLAWSELEEARVPAKMKPRIIIDSVNFVEFDSSNPSHAGGYFLVEVSSSKENIATVEKLHTKWMEG